MTAALPFERGGVSTPDRRCTGGRGFFLVSGLQVGRNSVPDVLENILSKDPLRENACACILLCMTNTNNTRAVDPTRNNPANPPKGFRVKQTRNRTWSFSYDAHVIEFERISRQINDYLANATGRGETERCIVDRIT